MQQETPRDAWRRWEADQAAAIVDSINEVREARGISLRRMADLLAEAGWPIGFGTLAGILSAKKRAGFTVAEVFVFARALSVPPGYLMLGLPAGQVPGRPVVPDLWSTGDLLLWFTGEAAPDGVSGQQPGEPDDVTASAMLALKNAAHLSAALTTARQLNDQLVAAQSIDFSGLNPVIAEMYSTGQVLRDHLLKLHDWFEDWGSGHAPLRPPLPAPAAPWDVVLKGKDAIEQVELPLSGAHEQDVSRERARLRALVEMNRSNRRRDLPSELGAGGA